MTGWLLLAWMFAAHAFAAGEITVDAVRRGDAIEVAAHAELTADVPTAWRVLTQYDRYASFIPDLALSRTMQRNGTTAIVEQKGEARFLFFRYPLEVRLEIAETPPRSVRSRAIGGNLRELSGHYQLVPSIDGSRLDYTGRIVLAEAAPHFVHITAVRLNIARQFEALVREIERQAVQ